MNNDFSLKFDLWKRRWRQQPTTPNITRESGSVPAGAGQRTFVVVCGPDFDMSVPNAATTCRIGWCRGFEELGFPYLFVSVFELAKRLPLIPRPILWISGSDYTFLDTVNLRALKQTEHFVWINTWFKGDTDYYAANRYPNNSHPVRLNERILSSDPAFVFTISPEASFEYYDIWSKRGSKLVSLPLACDTGLYTAQAPFVPEFEDVEMAFVGGYWPYKALQFDRYLKPYQDRLKVFGYSPWPYAGYGGRLQDEKESSLYRQARLSPTVNEPHVERMGIDLNERVFKVLGSGGMTITDMTPGYRAWFSKDELLVPESIDEYHDMVNNVLHDDRMNLAYREKGRVAVMARHTYVHRARTVLEHLGITQPPDLAERVGQ